MPAHMDQTAPAAPTNVVGAAPVFTDPLWRVEVELSPLEVGLLRTEPVRRLHFVVHGGASAISTLQSYSRLEHTLGVLALVVRFRPRDELLRIAALLHDVGHLPLSHTFEGLGGLDHHAIGSGSVLTEPLRGLLEEHGVDAGAVVALLDGEPRSPLTGRSGLLNLDHLDSYVRSGRAAGRLDVDPAALLGRLGLVDSAVSADREDAGTLVGLVAAEARLHTSWDNVGPVSVVRRLAGRLLDDTGLAPARLARMTDHEFWSALDACAATREESRRIRYEPHRLEVTAGHAAGDDRTGWDFSLRKIYSSAPLVDGERIEAAAPALAEELDALRLLPTDFHVRWR
ncbi:HD domain-containing protein [Streptomyces sp. SP17BM10]|uniref:HD domain-containing protein n=1 Tax=Streptomyces sp. SP17BM10 TaxID=3002530 RepID=UPI002E799ED1|nr:HD domain-containing protein [Streptomyces sp. SP17BM10]MEE1788284.1 HD domain-containing protein [Streptomyces sp. SP17BM10]